MDSRQTEPDHRRPMLRRKSWFACALGQMACGETSPYSTSGIPRMFAENGNETRRWPLPPPVPVTCQGQSSDPRGLRKKRLNADQRRDLFEIVEDRHNNATRLISIQLRLAKWDDAIGERTFTDAILDPSSATHIAWTFTSLQWKTSALKISTSPSLTT